MSIVPTIDIAPAFEGDAETRRIIAAQVGDACKNVGFLMVKGHGLPREVIDEVDRLSREFFDLPLDEKMAIAIEPGKTYRGYRRVGISKLTRDGQGAALPDLRESIFTGAEPVAGDPYYAKPGADHFFHANAWPERPAGMQQAFKTYYSACARLASTLMQLMAIALDLPETYFDTKIDRHISALNAMHYPKQVVPAETGQFRAAAHTDYGSLTVLATDGLPGLQVLVDDIWHDVTAPRETFIINLGDLMARWTNDRWRSTLHRVVNPAPEVAATTRRLSLVFFHQPNFDAVIECIPTCLKPGEDPKFPPITSGQHLEEQIAKTYGAKKEAA